MEAVKRSAHRIAVERIEPELALAKAGLNTDPRLVELVRLLARRSAREWYRKLASDDHPQSL